MQLGFFEIISFPPTYFDRKKRKVQQRWDDADVTTKNELFSIFREFSNFENCKFFEFSNFSYFSLCILIVFYSNWCIFIIFYFFGKKRSDIKPDRILFANTPSLVHTKQNIQVNFQSIHR